MMGKLVAGRTFRNTDDLWEALQKAVKTIDPQQVIALYESMPDRMEAVLQAKGRHTRY